MKGGDSLIYPWIFTLSCLISGSGGTRPECTGEVRLSPQKGHISWSISLGDPEADDLNHGFAEPVEFDLHKALKVRCTGEGILELISSGPRVYDPGIDPRPEIIKNQWRWTPPKEGAVLQLSAEGIIREPRREIGAGSSRSFSSTAGTIEEEGVFLAGSTAWIPQPRNSMLTFDLSVILPADWDAVSQGRRVDHQKGETETRVRWECSTPQEEIYLVAGKYFDFYSEIDGIDLMAFLRQDDSGLAAKYLEATQQYIEMYSGMLGPYPQPKFALVENFWETGYGMPSFTLLGPKVIRLPFIIRSSYPHEILHDYWGNSVYVDVDSGNWCEGLTAYLADHLMKEVSGQGAEYRRDVLKKYASYVQSSEDFPLEKFRSRHSGATEAIGYGKCLMLWHMLRLEMGDDRFISGLGRFYRDNIYSKASFQDIANALQVEVRASGMDVTTFVDAWVTTIGAPELELKVEGDEFTQIEISQALTGNSFPLRVPVYWLRSSSNQWEQGFASFGKGERVASMRLGSDVESIRVDPFFDVFRRLDSAESPPTLGDIFGADRGIIVLPKESRPGQPWHELASTWAESGDFEIVSWDDYYENSDIGNSTEIWFLSGDHVGLNDLFLEESPFSSLKGDTDVSTIQVRRKGDQTLGWIQAPMESAIPGLARKLPHYGKYSYLAFRGEEPANFMKGQWSAVGSPLFWDSPGSRQLLPSEKRSPLARPGEVIDPRQVMKHVEWLADPEREGRGVGSEGLQSATLFVAGEFEKAGLIPAAPDGSFIDSWQEVKDGNDIKLENVLGIIPGSNPELNQKPVVVMAHVDHLGNGWPDVRAGNEGKIHPGADDNASGVAVLIETARWLKRVSKPERPILFVATSGEEWGLKGSRRLVSGGNAYPLTNALAAISIDAVGRFGENQLLALGTGTATEWVHIVRGVGFTTGVEAISVNDDPGGSDHVTFHQMGISGIQLTTGPHADYHRPSDTAEKVNAEGLVKVCKWLKETLAYLGDRKEPLTSTLKQGSENGAERTVPTGARKIYLGTVPDFTDPGPGVRFDSVMPDSPAEKAGLRTGDRLMALNGKSVIDLRMYSQLLKKLEPGIEVLLEIEREGERKIISILPTKR